MDERSESYLFWLAILGLVFSYVLPFGSLPMVLFGLLAMGCGFYLGAVSIYRVLVNVKRRVKHEPC
jgi:hypothetical protein